MTTLKTPQRSNPLANFMRKPKLSLKLPSNGVYWPENSIVIPENKELPVYSMTAKDELAIKSPDALLNGQAIVDVIQSCVPSIKDAWKTPNIDLDVLLIAIRIATYGDMLSLKYVVPVTNENSSLEINLRDMLEEVTNRDITWEEIVPINEELTCYVRPLTYKHIGLTSLKTFETQRLMESANNDQLSDEKKLEIFNQSFKTMSTITFDLVNDAVQAVETPDGAVTDKKFIREFLENADKEVFQKVQDHIGSMREQYGVQPIVISATPEQIDKGVPETFEVTLSVVNSDFFSSES